MTQRSPAEKFNDLINRAMRALRPYDQDAVIIGGFAAMMYRHLPGFVERGLTNRYTQDLDVLVSDPLAVRGSTSLHDALIAEGLVQYTGTDLRNRPAYHRYQLAEDGAERPAKTYIEFLVPMIGRPTEEPARLQGATVLAQSVRFLDLLSAEPVTVEDPRHGHLRLPHPLAFAIQKTRIRDERGQRAEKDQADAFLVIDGLHKQWPAWRDAWTRWLPHPHHGRWLQDVERRWRILYASTDSPGTREVARFYRGQLDEGLVHGVMRDFLAAVPSR